MAECLVQGREVHWAALGCWAKAGGQEATCGACPRNPSGSCLQGLLLNLLKANGSRPDSWEKEAACKVELVGSQSGFLKNPIRKLPAGCCWEWNSTGVSHANRAPRSKRKEVQWNHEEEMPSFPASPRQPLLTSHIVPAGS